MAALRQLALLFLVVFLSKAAMTQAECSVPPQFWCDSPEISADCGVTQQCKDLVRSNANLVNVGLYYESLCPGCRVFIMEQLYPAYQKIGSIMNVTLVPYGNARYQYRSDLPLKYYFTCQHGTEECIGNLIETCAMDIYKNVSAYFPFINCVESSRSVPRSAAIECALQYKLDNAKIMSCANSARGHYLEYLMAAKTDGLQPPHQYTPWITLNGVHTDSIQNKAQTDLVGLVCSTYTGSPKPAACTGQL